MGAMRAPEKSANICYITRRRGVTFQKTSPSQPLLDAFITTVCILLKRHYYLRLLLFFNRCSGEWSPIGSTRHSGHQ
jgi:hypothetical protein